MNHNKLTADCLLQLSNIYDLIRRAEKFKSVVEIFEETNQPFELAKAYFYYAESLLQRAEVGEKIPRPLWERARVRKQEDEKEIARLIRHEVWRKDAMKYLKKAKEIFEKIGARPWLKKTRSLLNQ
jgi:hypothetical protein